MLNWKNLSTNLLFISVGFIVAGCEVVDLDSNGKPIIPMSEAEAAALSNMEPKDIAEKIWNDILQDAKSSAADSITNLANNKSYFVRLVGVIESIDDKQNIQLKVDNNTILIQNGSILRGNAIRDASSMISFDQFKNQVQFAKLSKELSKKAVAGMPKLDNDWIGKNVEILTALTIKNNQVQDAVPLEIIER
ncbi:putative lipoprotein [Cricetibacter osteomyelitidis]|uniref:Putative lipoprotein n=1 Tax=Cricetibacter osteomyelitidis TaxID=1521931 RepID=A0A4R2SUY2_9PAST|nr:DUF2291 family protein [Cricetibacter osteomyelitidis]TCP92144.1 putative lipoprotein [Cricetibacter osteomyelitidis]